MPITDGTTLEHRVKLSRARYSPLTVTWEGRSDCRLYKKGCRWLGRLKGVETSFPDEGFPAVVLAGWGLVKSWRDKMTGIHAQTLRGRQIDRQTGRQSEELCACKFQLPFCSGYCLGWACF